MKQSITEIVQQAVDDAGQRHKDVPEKEFYGELMAVAEGWRMRLAEIEEE